MKCLRCEECKDKQEENKYKGEIPPFYFSQIEQIFDIFRLGFLKINEKYNAGIAYAKREGERAYWEGKSIESCPYLGGHKKRYGRVVIMVSINEIRPDCLFALMFSIIVVLHLIFSISRKNK